MSFNSTYVLCFEAAAVLSEDMADQVRPEYCRCMRWKEGPRRGFDSEPEGGVDPGKPSMVFLNIIVGNSVDNPMANLNAA